MAIIAPMKLLIILLITLTSLFGVVSIKPVEIGDAPGITTAGGVSLDSRRGNPDRNNYSGSVRLTYDNSINYVTWGEVAAEYGDAAGRKNANNLYGHIRHIRKIDSMSNSLRAEYFTQIQSDEFKRIENRALGGAGMRYRLLDLLNSISSDFFSNASAYVGVGGFYEYIGYTTSTDPYENNIRLNTYFAYTMQFDKKTSLSYTYYYQPKIDEIDDYMTFNKLELKVNVYEQMYLSFNVYYNIDSVPLTGLIPDDYGQTTNFIFEF